MRMTMRMTRTLAPGWQSAPRVRHAHLLRMRQYAHHTVHCTLHHSRGGRDGGCWSLMALP